LQGRYNRQPVNQNQKLSMRLSRFPLSTLKETPADAEVISHQLMMRAGMLRKQAAGVYSWLPLGLRVLRKVESIVREESRARILFWPDARGNHYRYRSS
jgi:hypothetical protein